MTRYRYFLLSSVLQFPYSFNVQQYKFFFAPPPSPRLCPHFAPLRRKSCHRPCLTSIKAIKYSRLCLQSSWLEDIGRRAYQTKTQERNDFRQHLTDVRVGVEQNVIDDGIDQWRRRLHACLRATGRHFKYSLCHKLVKSLLTVMKLS